MTEADLIVEQILGIVEEVGSGIYMKRLDSGREVYTAKCPVCGTLHGGFRTFDQAKANQKCREHYRKEIEKLRKEVEKVDEPKKQKNIFRDRLNKAAVIGETQEDEFEVDEIEADYWKDVAEPAPDHVAYAIFDGREHYPVSRDGFIGRQGWDMGWIRQLNKQWKVEGIELSTEPGVYVSWPNMVTRMNKGETLRGYIIDFDHGTKRQWGRDARVYRITVNETELDIQSVLLGVNLHPGDVSKFVCENARRGQEFWHRYYKHADGSPVSVQASGPCLTWEDRPNEYKLPVKYGLFQTLYITEANAGEYTTLRPSAGE
jgi:hypothetical protein